MASISTTAAIIMAAVSVAGTAASATVSNMNAIKARQEAGKAQAQNVALAKQQQEAALAAANKSTGAVVSNQGDVSLQSEESLDDAAIRDKSKKNRLRVNSTTGVSLGNASSGSATGLRI